MGGTIINVLFVIPAALVQEPVQLFSLAVQQLLQLLLTLNKPASLLLQGSHLFRKLLVLLHQLLPGGTTLLYKQRFSRTIVTVE